MSSSLNVSLSSVAKNIGCFFPIILSSNTGNSPALLVNFVLIRRDAGCVSVVDHGCDDRAGHSHIKVPADNGDSAKSHFSTSIENRFFGSFFKWPLAHRSVTYRDALPRLIENSFAISWTVGETSFCPMTSLIQSRIAFCFRVSGFFSVIAFPNQPSGYFLAAVLLWLKRLSARS